MKSVSLKSYQFPPLLDFRCGRCSSKMRSRIRACHRWAPIGRSWRHLELQKSTPTPSQPTLRWSDDVGTFCVDTKIQTLLKNQCGQSLLDKRAVVWLWGFNLFVFVLVSACWFKRSKPIFKLIVRKLSSCNLCLIPQSALNFWKSMYGCWIIKMSPLSKEINEFLIYNEK